MPKESRKQRSGILEKRQFWTPDEHAQLALLVEISDPPVRWNAIADAMCQLGFKRSAKQCRHRWVNVPHETPCIRQKGWTPEEKEMVARMHAEFGPAWHKIATKLQGRTENQVKNLWNSTMRHKSPNKKRPGSILAAYVRLIRQGLPPNISTLEAAKQAMTVDGQSMETDASESKVDQCQSFASTSTATVTILAPASKRPRPTETCDHEDGCQVSGRTRHSCASTKQSCARRAKPRRANLSLLNQAVIQNLKAIEESECHSKQLGNEESESQLQHLNNQESAIECNTMVSEITTDQAATSLSDVDMEEGDSCGDEDDTSSTVDLMSDDDDDSDNDDDDAGDNDGDGDGDGDDSEDVVDSGTSNNTPAEIHGNTGPSDVVNTETDSKEAHLKPPLAVVDSDQADKAGIDNTHSVVVGSETGNTEETQRSPGMVNSNASTAAAGTTSRVDNTEMASVMVEPQAHSDDKTQHELGPPAGIAPVISDTTPPLTLKSWESIASTTSTNVNVAVGKVDGLSDKDNDMLTNSIQAARQRALSRLQNAVSHEGTERAAMPVGLSHKGQLRNTPQMLPQPATNPREYSQPAGCPSQHTTIPSSDYIQAHTAGNPNPHTATHFKVCSQADRQHEMTALQSKPCSSLGDPNRDSAALQGGECLVHSQPVGNLEPSKAVHSIVDSQGGMQRTFTQLQSASTDMMVGTASAQVQTMVPFYTTGRAAMPVKVSQKAQLSSIPQTQQTPGVSAHPAGHPQHQQLATNQRLHIAPLPVSGSHVGPHIAAAQHAFPQPQSAASDTISRGASQQVPLHDEGCFTTHPKGHPQLVGTQVPQSALSATGSKHVGKMQDLAWLPNLNGVASNGGRGQAAMCNTAIAMTPPSGCVPERHTSVSINNANTQQDGLAQPRNAPCVTTGNTGTGRAALHEGGCFVSQPHGHHQLSGNQALQTEGSVGACMQQALNHLQRAHKETSGLAGCPLAGHLERHTPVSINPANTQQNGLAQTRNNPCETKDKAGTAAALHSGGCFIADANGQPQLAGNQDRQTSMYPNSNSEASIQQALTRLQSAGGGITSCAVEGRAAVHDNGGCLATNTNGHAQLVVSLPTNTVLRSMSGNQAATQQGLTRLQTWELSSQPQRAAKQVGHTKSPFQGISTLPPVAPRTSPNQLRSTAAPTTASHSLTSQTVMAVGYGLTAQAGKPSVSTHQANTTTVLTRGLPNSSSLMSDSLQSQFPSNTAPVISPHHSRQLSCESVTSSTHCATSNPGVPPAAGMHGVCMPPRLSREEFLDSLRAVEMVAQAVGLQHQNLTGSQGVTPSLQENANPSPRLAVPCQQSGKLLCQQWNEPTPVTSSMAAAQGPACNVSNITAPQAAALDKDTSFLDFLFDMDCDLFT